MTGDEAGGQDRACTACGEPLPDQRSVCPACGTLQRAPEREGAGVGPATGTHRRPGPLGGQPEAAPAPAGLDLEAAPPHRARPTAMVVVVVLACFVGVLGLGVLLDRRNDPDATTTTTTAGASGGRAEAIRGFCADPRPLSDPPGIAAFTPGAGAVAYVRLPKPTSSTEPPGEATVQVSPTVGPPDLVLDESVGFVSLAVCLDQTGAERTDSTCDYELTNPGSLGEQASANLVQTTYAIELRELRTGKVVADGRLSTPITRCPDLAFLDPGKGVSNAVEQQQVLDWIAQNLPGGRPA